MTLDEAIKHAEEVAEKNEWFDKNYLENMQCRKCAEEHRQLAEWLKELKQLREQTKWIPVSERLPKEHTTVIGTTEFNDIYEAELYNDCGKSKWYADSNYDVPIVAWMPLPEPHKAESEET